MRLLGVNIPDKKSAFVALSYIYGLGMNSAKLACRGCGVDERAKLDSLSRDQIDSLARFIESNFTIEGDLRKSVSFSIKHLVDIKCYRGVRHRKSLPLRGQRTRTNARTRKGKSGLPIAAKKKI